MYYIINSCIMIVKLLVQPDPDMTSPTSNGLASKLSAEDADDPMRGSGHEGDEEGEDVGIENVDDSSEEEEEDEEEAQRVREGFIVDEDEEEEDDGPKKRHKKRKKDHHLGKRYKCLVLHLTSRFIRGNSRGR
jgi:hypothetical protein